MNDANTLKRGSDLTPILYFGVGSFADRFDVTG